METDETESKDINTMKTNEDNSIIDKYLLLGTIASALPSKVLSACGITAIAYNLADELSNKHGQRIENKLVLLALASTAGIVYAAIDYALEAVLEKIPQIKYFSSSLGSVAVAGLVIKVYNTLIESLLVKELLYEEGFTSKEVLAELREMVDTGEFKALVMDSFA